MLSALNRWHVLTEHPVKPEELEDHLPASMKRFMAENDINFYIIDASAVPANWVLATYQHRYAVRLL